MEKENLRIRINLGALKASGVATLQGKSGSKKCLIIPIEDNHLYQGTKGVYLDLIGWRNDKLSDGGTHLIKQSLPKEVRDQMDEKARFELPTLGNIAPMNLGVENSEASSEFAGATMSEDQTDDHLPF